MQAFAATIQALAGWPQPLLLGLWFGLLHAFDPDHLATLGALASNDRRTSAAAYAARWAAGHALALGLFALAVLGLGLTQAAAWSGFIELAVAATLIAIGAWGLITGADRGGAPQTTAHRALRRPHLHFFAAPHAHAGARSSAGVLMGVLHGGAGSAAVLALLPLTRLESAAASAAYLACFSLGVAAGALGFAAAFGRIAARASAAGARVGTAFRRVVAALAIGAGSLLAYEILFTGGAHGG